MANRKGNSHQLPPGFVEIPGESLIDRRVRIFDLWKLHKRKGKPKRELTLTRVYESHQRLQRKVQKLTEQLKGCRCHHDR